VIVTVDEEKEEETGRRVISWLPRPRPSRDDRADDDLELGVRTFLAVEALTVVGLLCAWMVCHLLLFGMLSETRSQSLLYGEFREQLASATAPTGGVIAPGKPVAVLTIPALGLEQVVVEGTASDQLLQGPGHLRSTVLPGQGGNSVIFGRARSFGGPFGRISALRVGHAIYVATGQGRSAYRVDGVRRGGDPLPSPLGKDGGRLTLVSAWNRGASGLVTPHEVYYVDATLVSRPYEAPSGRLNSVSPAELAMGKDVTVLPTLALSLGALAAVVAGGLFARQRLGRPVVWVLGIPILLALAWVTSDRLMSLLPNLI
jgi:sortase A